MRVEFQLFLFGYFGFIEMIKWASSFNMLLWQIALIDFPILNHIYIPAINLTPDYLFMRKQTEFADMFVGALDLCL